MREHGDEDHADRMTDYTDLVSGRRAGGRWIWEIAFPTRVGVPDGFYRTRRHAVEDWLSGRGISCCLGDLCYRFRTEDDALEFRAK